MDVALDIYDPGFIEDPYPTLSAIREETPIFYGTKEKDGGGLWFLTRHEDVQRVQRDRRLGRSHEHVMSREELGLPPLRADWGPWYAVEQWSLLFLEPPEHTRIRLLVSKAFTPKRVASLRPSITEHADRLLDVIVERGHMDLLTDYAQPYSVHVIAELLGAPTDDWPLLLAWSHQIVKMYELNTTEEQSRTAVQACVEFDAWCRDLIADRRANPRDDLVTALCLAETDEGSLSDGEIVSTIILLLNAGHEATVNTMGNGMRAMLLHPEQWRRVASGEVAPDVAVEEMIRWDPPLQLFERWVLHDGYEIAGQQIAKGEKVAMLFGAANRDPRQFRDPDTFDVSRGDSTHITFGAGIHHCLGAPLARLELDVALSRLARRCPNLELMHDPERIPAFVIRGLRSVDVAIG